MRIGMLADVYKPHVSGITNYIALNKRHLEKLGHEVFVFTFGDESHECDELNVIHSRGLPLLDTGYYLGLRYNKRARLLMQSMDVVHVHHPFLSGSLALRYCRPRGIPVIFTNHTRYDLYAQAYIPALPDVVGVTALETYLPSFCRSCDLVISPSNGMRDVLKGFGVETFIDVVPNGVDLRPFRETTQPLNRKEIGFKKDDIVLIYTGRLGPEKNLPFLLRSFAGAAQAYDNLRLVLVGSGPELDNLQDRVRHMGIESLVYFAGMVSYEEMPRYLAMADAFVTASVTEVHPLSVIEAMAAGLPVLGIQSPGVGDIVIPGETGLLVAEEDLASYTAKMVRIVTDHDLRRAMSKNACQASEAYAIERTTHMLLERYQDMIRKGSRRKRTLRARMLRLFDGWSR